LKSENETENEVQAKVLKQLVRELAVKVPDNIRLESISEEKESKHSPYDASYVSSQADDSKPTHREVSLNSSRKS
jgi:hypothetical protein